MNISATVTSSHNVHEVALATNGVSKSIAIAPKSNGFGSSVNGGELLLLALATCYCNDLYREAGKRNIVIEHAEVECTAAFVAEGEPGANFEYRVKIQSPSPASEIDELLVHTDTVAEIQNTLRKGVSVKLVLP